MRRALLGFAGAAGGVLLTAGPAFAATTGAQGFTLTSSGRGPLQVTATGPIHGAAVDKTSGPTHDQFVFPQGAVNVQHAPTSSHQGPTAGCTTFYTERGTYGLAGGTGAYAGASGGGTYFLHDVSFAKMLPNGTCSQKPSSNLTTIFAHGTTTLP